MMPPELNHIAMVDRLANGDITKYNTIYLMPYEECLHTLELYHYQDKYYEQLNRIERLKNS